MLLGAAGGAGVVGQADEVHAECPAALNADRWKHTYWPLARPVMVQVVVLAGTDPRSLDPLSSSKPVSLFELSFQVSRIAEPLTGETVRLLGAVGAAGGGVVWTAGGGVVW